MAVQFNDPHITIYENGAFLTLKYSNLKCIHIFFINKQKMLNKQAKSSIKHFLCQKQEQIKKNFSYYGWMSLEDILYYLVIYLFHYIFVL